MHTVDTCDSLGVGLYTLNEAARLLRTPRRTLSRWVEGYVQKLRSGSKSYDPVLEREGEASFLTFGDLIELMYVRGFREGGVLLDDIRLASRKYREAWNTSYPLATKRFATAGRSLLLQEGGTWQHALSGQKIIVFEEVGRKLVHIGDFVSEWRPLGQDRSVVLNPKRSFGKPIEDASGAHTYVLSQALSVGDSAADIAWWYDTTEQAVLDAAEFEREWSPAQRTRTILRS